MVQAGNINPAAAKTYGSPGGRPERTTPKKIGEGANVIRADRDFSRQRRSYNEHRQFYSKTS